MKTLPVLLLCLAGAAAGTGIGWLLRGAPAPAASPDNIAASTPVEISSSRKVSAFTKAGANDSSADDLAAELSRQAGPLRWLYLLGAAEKAAAADMPRLVLAAKGLPGATKMLATRWAELDAQHMFETLRADHARGGTGLSADFSLTSVLFEEWTKKDREAAIAALSDVSALKGLEGQRYFLTNSVMKTDPARGLQLLSDWNITNYSPDTTGLMKWAEQNPRAAAEAAMKLASSHTTAEFLKGIGAAWAKTDPAAALAFAAEKRGMSGIQLAQSVIAGWAQRDLDAAIAHVGAQTDSQSRARLGLPLVEAWAKTDPRAALLWANENLKGEARAAAAASVVKTMAASDLDGAAQFIAGLEPGGGKNRAAIQLMEAWLGNTWLNNGGVSTPGNSAKTTAALEWMMALPDADARRQVMEQASWRLFYAAADDTVAFLGTPQGAQAPQEMFDRAAQHLTKKNPEAAMQWAAALPENRRTAAQYSVLGEWINTRPEAAMDWVRALPAGTQRRESITSTTINLSWQSMETSRRWLTSLPAADRPAALEGLQGNGSLSPENRAALEALVK